MNNNNSNNKIELRNMISSEHGFVVLLDFSGDIDVKVVQRNVLAALQRAVADGAISGSETEIGLDKIEIAGPIEAYHWKTGDHPDYYTIESCE